MIEARKGMNMGSFWGGGTEVSGEMKKRPRGVPRAHSEDENTNYS